MSNVTKPAQADQALRAATRVTFDRTDSDGCMSTNDTVMLLGMLGWDKYDGKVEFITELFASSGTGQVNAVSPLPETA